VPEALTARADNALHLSAVGKRLIPVSPHCRQQTHQGPATRDEQPQAKAKSASPSVPLPPLAMTAILDSNERMEPDARARRFRSTSAKPTSPGFGGVGLSDAEKATLSEMGAAPDTRT